MATYAELCDAHASQHKYPEPWFSEQTESMRREINDAKGKRRVRFEASSPHVSDVLRRCLRVLDVPFRIEMDGKNGKLNDANVIPFFGSRAVLIVIDEELDAKENK